MSVVTKYINRLQEIKSKDLYIWGKEAILENKDQIVNLVKYKQLTLGKNSNGLPLAWEGGDGYYAASTQDYADLDGISTPKIYRSPYNFYWSGETLENLYLKSVNKQKATFDISTVAYKKKLLESIYGEIFNLTKEHNEYVNEQIIKPYLYKKLFENMFQL